MSDISNHEPDGSVETQGPSHDCSLSVRPRIVEEGPAQPTLDGQTTGRVVSVIPLLVEYSEDDDTGCAFGAAVMIGVTVSIWLLLRLAIMQTRR